MTRNEIERIAVERIGPDDGSKFYQYRLFAEKKKVYYEYATIRFGPLKRVLIQENEELQGLAYE